MQDEQHGGGYDPGQQPEGRMRFQDSSTTPREPTLAERKAREQAIRRQQEAEEAAVRAAADGERARKKRKRILIGSGIGVGLVGIIAIGYATSGSDTAVQAQCVDEQTGQIVADTNCVTPAAAGTTHYGGGGFYPIFIGGGGRQYHYNYGGSGSIGRPVSGGTTVVPRDSTKVVTSSGKSISGGGTPSVGKSTSGSSSGSGSVSRGGLGSSSSSGSSSGGHSSGS